MRSALPLATQFTTLARAADISHVESHSAPDLAVAAKVRHRHAARCVRQSSGVDWGGSAIPPTVPCACRHGRRWQPAALPQTQSRAGRQRQEDAEGCRGGRVCPCPILVGRHWEGPCDFRQLAAARDRLRPCIRGIGVTVPHG